MLSGACLSLSSAPPLIPQAALETRPSLVHGRHTDNIPRDFCSLSKMSLNAEEPKLDWTAFKYVSHRFTLCPKSID